MTRWEELLESGDDLLWEKLRRTEKNIVLYGMGNGADKILDVCAEKGIQVRGVFASDGFRTGKQFRGMTVESRREIFDRFGKENTVVLLAFASARPEVLELIRGVAAETELYVPDVPVAGNTLFDADFARTHREDLLRARDLLCDEESRRIFDLTVAAKLTGRAECLFQAVSDPAEAMRELVRPEEIRTALDLGAYTGDTVRELLNAGAKPEAVYAVEPDARTLRKLADYAEQEMRTTVIPLHAAAWNRRETLPFGAAGNRGSAVGEAVKKALPVEGIPMDEVLGDARVDYVKFDVEGAEREAIEGLSLHLARDLPTLLVSVYHRSEDLFALPLLLHERFDGYGHFFLRRFSGLPAWDLNLYVRR
ncbi:MAG TPA: FkbM family methyltransferase [Clostridiales bacterium]|nr:FkbM family methyltransferase [Clostridiales bacterium]